MADRDGEWIIDRKWMEDIVSNNFWQAMQSFVDDGLLVEFTARRKHQDFLKSPAFQQAVDGAIRQSVDTLNRLEREDRG